MKISTKGRYALRLMLDIALHDTDEPVRVKDIAKRQDISVKYLEQIISVLVRAEYLRSIRGPQGGYRLTKKPEDYKVGMILRLTEGILAPVDCLMGEEKRLLPGIRVRDTAVVEGAGSGHQERGGQIYAD